MSDTINPFTSLRTVQHVAEDVTSTIREARRFAREKERQAKHVARSTHRLVEHVAEDAAQTADAIKRSIPNRMFHEFQRILVHITNFRPIPQSKLDAVSPFFLYTFMLATFINSHCLLVDTSNPLGILDAENFDRFPRAQLALLLGYAYCIIGLTRYVTDAFDAQEAKFSESARAKLRQQELGRSDYVVSVLRDSAEQVQGFFTLQSIHEKLCIWFPRAGIPLLFLDLTEKWETNPSLGYCNTGILSIGFLQGFLSVSSPFVASAGNTILSASLFMNGITAWIATAYDASAAALLVVISENFCLRLHGRPFGMSGYFWRGIVLSSAVFFLAASLANQPPSVATSHFDGFLVDVFFSWIYDKDTDVEYYDHDHEDYHD